MTALPPQLRAVAKMAAWCRQSSDGEVVASGIALEELEAVNV
jgi:hypothetical protein